MKRAFLVFHPQTSGGRMITRDLVAAGCFGDPQPGWRYTPETHAVEGHWQRLDALVGLPITAPGMEHMPKELRDEWSKRTFDDLGGRDIVWRRSVPHGLEWHVFGIAARAEDEGYETHIVVPWRTRCETESFRKIRGTWEDRDRALALILSWCATSGHPPTLVHYDAYVMSPEYRRFVFALLGLKLPWGLGPYVHAGKRWDEEEKWLGVELRTTTGRMI